MKHTKNIKKNTRSNGVFGDDPTDNLPPDEIHPISSDRETVTVRLNQDIGALEELLNRRAETDKYANRYQEWRMLQPSAMLSPIEMGVAEAVQKMDIIPNNNPRTRRAEFEEACSALVEFMGASNNVSGPVEQKEASRMVKALITAIRDGTQHRHYEGHLRRGDALYDEGGAVHYHQETDLEKKILTANLTRVDQGLQCDGDLTPLEARSYGLKEVLAPLENTVFKGSLFLNDRRITDLPKGLTIEGNCKLEGTNVRTLPLGMVVKGDLFAHGVPLDGLPTDLKVGGTLDIRHTNISVIPDQMKAPKRILAPSDLEGGVKEYYKKQQRGKSGASSTFSDRAGVTEPSGSHTGAVATRRKDTTDLPDF